MGHMGHMGVGNISGSKNTWRKIYSYDDSVLLFKVFEIGSNFCFQAARELEL